MASRIKGITVEIGGDTTKLTESLKGVDSQIRKTQGALRDVNRLLKLDPSNTDLLRQKQRLLGDEIRTTKERLSALKEAARNVTPEDIGQDKYDALQREIAETEQKLKDLERQAAESASVLGSQMQAAGEKIREAGQRVTEIGTGLTTRLTLPLAAVGAAGVKSFAEVDKTMQLTNKTMGNTEDQARLLGDAMKEAASRSTFGMSDAAQAALNFARAGLSAEQAALALAPAMDLAAGEGGDLDTVSGGLVATINGFHGSFEEAAAYADVFAAACNNSALDIDSLSSAMSVAAPVFSSAGYSVNDAALFMGVMANAGIDAGTAANSLKTGLARLISPSKEGAEMMKALGISVTEADGSMKDSVQIQAELHDAFSTLSESEQIAAASAIFGKNQMSSWLALIGTAPEDVGALDSALSDCSGTTREMADAMMSGFGGSLEKLKSSLDVLVTSIGEALAPTIRKVSDVIQGLVDAFNALSPEQQEMIAQVGLAAAALGPFLVILGTLITTVGTIVGAVGAVLTAVAPVAGTIAAVMGSIHSLSGLMVVLGAILTGPVGIVAAIAAVIAAGVALWKNWDKVKAFAAQLGKKLAEVWKGIRTTITTAVTNVKAAAVNKFNELKASAIGVFNSIKSTAVTAWNNVKAAIIKPIESARDTVKRAVDKMRGFFNFKWSLPHIKLPHFSVSGSANPLDWLTQGVPRISVKWYRRAMTDPILLNGATIFGSMGGSLLGGGEAGREVVMSLDDLRKISGSDDIVDALDRNYKLLDRYLPVLTRMEVVMDTGATVGALAPGMDRALGGLAERSRRR